MRRDVSDANLVDGEWIPFGYGIAYREYTRMASVCYPIPLNLVIGLMRRLYFAIALALVPTAYDRAVQYGMTLGQRDEMRRTADRLLNVVHYRDELIRRSAQEAVREVVAIVNHRDRDCD